MQAISYNDIFDGISLALHTAYPLAVIHGGTVEQDLNEGDFNVLPVTSTHTAQLGSRARRDITFDVIYYPTATGGRADCLDIAQDLPSVLELIDTPNGNKLHCLSFESTIEDDVLHCIIRYPHFVYTLNTEADMEDVEIGGLYAKENN